MKDHIEIAKFYLSFQGLQRLFDLTFGKHRQFCCPSRSCHEVGWSHPWQGWIEFEPGEEY